MSTLAIARLLGGSHGQGRHFVTMGQSLMGREIVCLVIVVVQDWFQNFSFIVTFITHTMSTLLHQFPFNYSCVFSGNTLQKTT